MLHLQQKPKQQVMIRQEPDVAQPSLHAVTGLEIVSGISTCLLTTWALIPLQPRHQWLVAIPGLLAIGMMINSHRVRGESPSELGFTLQHFIRGLRLVLVPTLVASAV